MTRRGVTAITTVLAVFTLGATATASAPPAPSAADTPAWDDPTGALDAAAFANPPTTARPHAFWFWNGELTEAELSRQMDEMASQGVEEFFIHPREGLGGGFNQTENEYYLSTDWFDKVDFAVEQAAERGMKAWLYDDLNWPSGWAGGRTVRGGEVDGEPVPANPEMVPWFLSPTAEDVTGPSSYAGTVPVDPTPGPQAEQLVATLALPREEGASCVTDGEARGAVLDGDEVVDLTDQVVDGELTWEVPAGSWCLLHLVQKPLLEYHPDLEPKDEPFVDMLNPAATQKFIDITHEVYADRLGEHLGGTVPGIFNDEPGFYNNFPDGRGGPDSRGSVAWTPGFTDYLLERTGPDAVTDLAALWYDVGTRTVPGRVGYYGALTDRFNEAHTKPLADWADDHDMALISNALVEEDLGSHRLIAGGSWFEMSRHYQLPGMDLIGGLNTGVITPKLNSSVAHLFDRARNLSETFGAFGWDLSTEEMKRTVAWQAVGGVDLIDNHAFYYSIDGDRAFESPPSQFEQNPFWPQFRQYADLVGRLSEPARGSVPVNPVGLLYPTSSMLGTGTPWDVRGFIGNGPGLGPVNDSWTTTSNALLGAQLDFDYLDEQALADEAHLGVAVEVRDGELSAHQQRWQALVLPRTTILDPQALDTMEELVADGGTVVAVDGLPTRSTDGDDAALQTRLAALFGTDPAAPTRSTVEHPGGGMSAFLPSSAELADVVGARVDPGAVLSPASDDVRVRHVQRDGQDAYLLVNLAGSPVEATATLSGTGVPQRWDPNTGATGAEPVYRLTADGAEVPVRLDAYDAQWITFPEADRADRQAHLVATAPTVDDVTAVTAAGSALRTELVVDAPGPVWAVGERAGRRFAGTTEVTDTLEPLAVDGDWSFAFDGSATNPDPVPGPDAPVSRALGSWTDLDPDYSGAGTYTTTVQVPDGFTADRRITLDLGTVRDLAVVEVNGEALRPVVWAPWSVDVTDALREGANELRVTVTNTGANAIEGSPLPSGLLGPVSLRPSAVVDLTLQRPGQVTAGSVEVDERRSVLVGDAAEVTATLTGIAPGTLSAEVALDAPAGWTVQPNPLVLQQRSRGEAVVVSDTVTVTPPAGTEPGRYELTAVIQGPGDTSRTQTVVIEVVDALVAWDFDDGAQGWTAGNQVTPPQVAESALRFSATGGDPNVVGPAIEIPRTGGLVVEVTMTSSVAGEGEVFWTLGGGGFTAAQAQTFPVSAGTTTATVTIPPGDSPLTRLRLDPLRGPGDLAVDSIRVLPAN